MHSGHPCPGINLDNEYFEDGITNGAHWYSVQGKTKTGIICNVHVSPMHRSIKRHQYVSDEFFMNI